MFGFLGSSTNPDQVSATVSGLILTCSGLIIWALQHWFGIVLGSDQLSSIAQEAGVAFGALWAIFGIVRKVTLKVAGKAL